MHQLTLSKVVVLPPGWFGLPLDVAMVVSYLDSPDTPRGFFRVDKVGKTTTHINDFMKTYQAVHTVGLSGDGYT